MSIFNISGPIKDIKNNELNKILHNNEFEYKTNIVNIINKEKESINKIKTLIWHDHINVKEKKSIFKICDDYFKIFYLKRIKIVKERLIIIIKKFKERYDIKDTYRFYFYNISYLLWI